MDKFDKVYSELMEKLRIQIEAEFDSLQNFCRENQLSRQNLSRVFSGRQSMSVGLYLKIISSLDGVGGYPIVHSDLFHLSLKEYLQAPHDVIIKSILLVQVL